MPRAGRASGGVGAGGGPGATTQHGGNPGHQRFVDLLRANKMDVRVDAAWGEQHTFAGDDLRAGADDDTDAGLDIRVAGFAYGGDTPVLNADVGFDNAPVVNDQGIGDDRICDCMGHFLPLPHAIADHLAAAEFHFLAVHGVVGFDFDP